MAIKYDKTAEWLEADGLGGFASGTVSGIRTRRYHALLLPAVTPPTGRFVLVNGFDAFIQTPEGIFALSSQAYEPSVIHPDGCNRIQDFSNMPWPKWTFAFENGMTLTQEIFMRHGFPLAVVRWKLRPPSKSVRLLVRPFFSGRDTHSLHKENAQFDFNPVQENHRYLWKPYLGVPGVEIYSNGQYSHQPLWYRNFFYEQERARGLDFSEDLASPGIFQWDLSDKEALWFVGIENQTSYGFSADVSPETLYRHLAFSEKKRRAQFVSPLHTAADAYLVKRGQGKTIIAGYPWFTDWGRDTFIAMRGLCLASGRLKEACDILLEWSSVVSQGMLPNLFVDHGAQPEFNSVDASLWYIIAVYETLQQVKKSKFFLKKEDENKLWNAAQEILTGYAQGTRFGIRMDEDGLLASGVPGAQLTWMDAKIGDWVVTPRTGKPVEVQALWINALWIGGQVNVRWKNIFDQALETFRERFWNSEQECLYDVIDVDHKKGEKDSSFRPNQLFAVGGLPVALLEGDRARRVVEKVQEKLWTSLGLRSLAPGSDGYRGRYEGGVLERDSAYHQGTVWPWLTGAFVEAWLRVYGDSASKKAEARKKFVEPLLKHLAEAGIGHVSEIADAEKPHWPRGCPFQAWSLGELIRLETLLAPKKSVRVSPGKKKQWSLTP